MLVDVYDKCGSLEDARRVFEKMPHHKVVSWNAMILGYAQMGKGEVALQLYAQMQQEGYTQMKDGDEALQLYARMQELGMAPGDRTFVSAIKACSSLGDLEEGHEYLGGC